MRYIYLKVDMSFWIENWYSNLLIELGEMSKMNSFFLEINSSL